MFKLFKYQSARFEDNTWTKSIAAIDLGDMDVESAVHSLKRDVITSTEMFNGINQIQLQKIQKWVK